MSVLFMLWSGLAAAQTNANLAAEVASLKQEVAQQREILRYLLQDQQQRSTMLLQLLNAQKPAPMSRVEPSPAGPAPVVVPPSPQPVAAVEPAPSKPATYSVSGRVAFSGGKPGPAWVYVSDVTGWARGATLAIEQKNKTFVPDVALVQRGTQLVFPNLDAVFHDVFSRSPGNSFEIGAIQAGGKSRLVPMTKPGLVEIFCNLHSRMNAEVLVVPGPLFAQVDAQGRFRLDNVPAGKHTVVAWAARSQPVSKTVEVSGDTEGLEFTLTPQATVKPHLNKKGQAYGSYED
jgi:plastocyanin